MPYFVPYQSLGAATLTATNTQREEVVVNIKYLPKATEPAFSASSLSFKLGTTAVSGTPTATTTTAGYTASFLFNLPSVPITGTSGNEPCVYAYYGTKKIGKINITPLKRREEKVILVPVNGATAPSTTVLQTYLDSVYRQANVRFTVTEKTGFRFNLDTNNVAGLERAGSGINKYSAEMRMLRDKFASDTTYDKKANYIFVVSAFEGGGLDGFMVRGRSMGFVASGASKRTYAHELGHGAFGLEHTFPEIGQSLSNNLMDYGDSTHLTHKQCKDIAKRKFVFNWLDSEEDASATGGYAMQIYLYRKLSNDVDENFTKEQFFEIKTLLESIFRENDILVNVNIDYDKLFYPSADISIRNALNEHAEKNSEACHLVLGLNGYTITNYLDGGSATGVADIKPPQTYFSIPHSLGYVLVDKQYNNTRERIYAASFGAAHEAWHQILEKGREYLLRTTYKIPSIGLLSTMYNGSSQSIDNRKNEMYDYLYNTDRSSNEKMHYDFPINLNTEGQILANTQFRHFLYRGYGSIKSEQSLKILQHQKTFFKAFLSTAYFNKHLKINSKK